MATAQDTINSGEKINSAFDLKVIAFAEWVLKWRWLLIIATLLVAFSAASGARFLGFSTDYRVFFSDDNPQLSAFENLQKIYTKDDNIQFVIKPYAGDVFTPELLTAVRDLTEKSWKTPFATRVDSLTNFQHSYADGDDLTVRDLITRRGQVTQAAADEAKAISLTEPLLTNRLISPNGKTVAININLTLPGKSLDEGPNAMTYARQIADAFRNENPNVRVAITGLAALNNAFSEASLVDMETLIPLMYGGLLLVMVILLRSFSATIGTILVIGLSAVTAMGLTGWFGILLTPPSATAPTIILTIAIADSVHILITMLHEMRHGASKREAIIESLRVNFSPVFLTSITTMIGFLSLNFSDAPPFRDLGNITAMCVVAAWAYSILFLPALMSLLPVRVKQRTASHITGMTRLADFIIGKYKTVFGGMAAVVIILVALIPQIELNDKFVEYFDHSIEFRTDTDFAQENLTGVYQMQFSLTAGNEGGISDPEYQTNMDAFKVWFAKQPEVVHVQSLTDIMLRLNKNMHGDDAASYTLPEDRELAAQYLLLFEMSLPYGLDLNNQINVDKSATRFIATLRNVSTREARDLEDRAGTWLTDNFPTTAAAKATGPFIMFAYISQRNIEGMLTGTTVAFLLISLLLTFALRDLKLGAVSLVPNLVPALMAFGIWAAFIAQVDVAASIVVATSLGIIVDATVHFLSKYQRAKRQRGDDTKAAIRYAFSTVGTALWVTSAILIAGFAILSLSAFRINQELGLLTAITLVCALFADFLLLPALLLIVDKDKKSPHTKESTDDTSEPVTVAAE
ncbi:MAG: MMPL family transporter [Rhodospirillales bacterium]|nr:MMPL family transporter [Rhodospirillales bacterium]